MKKRILSIVLSILMLVGLLPMTARAVVTEKAIQLGTSGISDPTTTTTGNGTYKTPSDYVYFGVFDYGTGIPIKWRVLDADKANDGQTSGMFLLSEYLLGYTQFRSEYGMSANNKYEGSDAQVWCRTFAKDSSVFSSAEQSAFIGVTKTDTGGRLFNLIFYYGASTLTTDDKVFFLSLSELADYVGNYNKAPGLSATHIATNQNLDWWLRSPDSNNGTGGATAVSNDGEPETAVVKTNFPARPAFNLDTSKVLFTSAATNGKADAAVDSSLTKVGAATNEWKLTLLDTGRSLSVSQTSLSGAPGDTVSITYTGAKTGSNEYVSAMLAQGDTILYYGRIAQNSASGTAGVTIPSGLADGTYTLNVFSEQYNGDQRTDYASAFKNISLTVVSDKTAPTLSAGTADRTGEVGATVKFTSNEAGTYYYAVVESGAAAPTIDTTDTGTACTSGENTVSLSGLSGAGAKAVYIVVKDAAGNVSQPLNISIPACSYSVTLKPNGGTVNSGDVTGYTFGVGAALPTDVTRAGYSFGGWYENGNAVTAIGTTESGNKTFYAKWELTVPTVSEAVGYNRIYDGESHTISVTVAAGTDITYSYQWYKDGKNDSNMVDAAVYASHSVKNVADSGTYYCLITAANGTETKSTWSNAVTVSIAKRSVTLTSATAGKTYDGTALIDSSVTITGDGFVSGEGATWTVTGTQTSAGSSENTFTYMLNEGTDASNYNITATCGVLTVSKRTVTLTSADASKTYDGTALTNSTVTVGGDGFVSGEGATWTVTGAQTNAGSSSNTFTYTLNEGTKANNYDITKIEGTLTVSPLGDKVTVTITENSGTKEYNGSEQSVTGYTVSISSPLYKEADFTFSGEAAAKGTNVGTYQMELKPSDFSNTSVNFNNVEFIIVDGTLEITPYTENVAVTITENSETVKYDGSEQSLTGYTVSINNSLYKENDFSFSGNATARGTDAGTYSMELKPSDFSNANTNFTNVTFVIVDGTLTVNKRNVTLTSADASRTYDGTALTNSTVTVGGDGFVSGEGATWTVTGAQTNAGTSSNTFTYTLNEGTKANNYDITKIEGTLTVSPLGDKVTVTITENSGTKEYNGSEQSVTGYTVSISNALYTVNDFTFSGNTTANGTDAGTYNMGLKAEDFTNTSRNFTNVEFVIVDGALTITPKEISIASAGITPVTYDPNGYTLAVSGVTFDGAVTGHEPTYTAAAEFTDSDKTPGNRSVRVNVTLTDSNYSLSSTTFETTVSVSAAVPTATAPTAKTGLVYDGNVRALIEAGTSEHGHWEYSLDSTTYSSAIPTGTDAKTYTVYCRFVPNEGYDGIELLTLSVTIAPMGVDEPTAVGTYTYTGSEQTVALDGVLGCMTVSGNKATDAGDYVVSISLDGNHKWNAESDGEIAWSIVAKTVIPTAALEYASIIYSGSDRKPTVTLKDGDTEIPSGEYTVSYSNNVNVGTATVTITDKEYGNYTFAEITKTFEIMRDGVSPVVTMDNYVYGGTPAVPNVSGNSGNGTVTVYYSTDSSKVDKLWEDISGTTLNVGTYYMKAHVASTDNYAEGISPVVTFKVTPGKYVAPSAPTASEFTVTVNEADRGKILEYSLDGTNWISVPVLTNGAFELKGLSESTQYTVYLRVKASADGNYQASDAVSTVWTTPARYSVAYHANLGTGNVPTSVTQNSGRSVTVARGSGLKRTGYTFAGWNTAADGTGTDYAPGSTISTGATLYAKWTANSYTVKFKANGGSGTMDDQNFTYDVTQALTGNAFTRDGYHFAGWALASGNTTIYMDGQAVKNLSDKGTVTLHAVWVEDVYSIRAYFSSDSNHSINAKLMRGDAQIGSTQSVTMSGTDAPYTGHFDFTGVPKGIYNIVAEQDGKVITKLIIITDHDDTVEITMPASEVNSVLEVSEDAPPVVVGGLEDEAVTKAEESKTVTITMTVEKQEEQQLPDNASEFEKATQEAIAEIKEEASGKTFEFMDIEVEKTVEEAGQADVSEKLTETNKVMEIVISFDLTGKRDITVYRHHNGQTEQFAENTTKADGTFYIDETNHLIHVFSRKFSTYAIGYTEPASPAPDHPPVVSVHTCTSKCDVCGGCEDAACTESACKDKCRLLGMNFTDVAEGKWYTEPVEYVYHHKMMEGVGNNLFDINGTTTRAMIVTILWRLEGEPVVNYLMQFEDIPADTWYTEAVRWAASEKIVEGYSDTAFGPTDPITREQFATILWRYAKYKGYDVSVGEDTNILSYEDAFSISEYAIPAMQWACGAGLMQGDGVNLTPKADATRAQAAALFQRFCENVAEK